MKDGILVQAAECPDCGRWATYWRAWRSRCAYASCECGAGFRREDAQAGVVVFAERRHESFWTTIRARRRGKTS